MSLYDLFPPEFFKLSVPLSAYLILSAILFTIGIATFLFRRNVITVFMAIELMLNAVNVVLVTADTTVRATLPHTGGVFALFVIVLAAAELGVGLAIVLQLYRLRQSVELDTVPLGDSQGSG